MFGLMDKDIEFILGEIMQYSNLIHAVGIFGSRATESFRAVSDIDLVIYGDKIDDIILGSIVEKLENFSPFPFYVDVVHYESIKDPVFKNQIDNSVAFIYKN